MRQTIPLKFTSATYEQEVMGICSIHRIDFASVEESVNNRYFIVEPGSIDASKFDIVNRRFVENPSPRLNEILYACVTGRAAVAGRPVLEGEILEGLIV